MEASPPSRCDPPMHDAEPILKQIEAAIAGHPELEVVVRFGSLWPRAWGAATAMWTLPCAPGTPGADPLTRPPP